MSVLHSKRSLLYLAIVVLGFDIGFYWVRADVQQIHAKSIPDQHSERNERSTPRSFILPATPAVAAEQDLRSSQDSAASNSRRQLALCAARLIDLGYEVGDEPVSFNAKLSEAIYKYQEARGLNKTGRLDLPTMESLSCKQN